MFQKDLIHARVPSGVEVIVSVRSEQEEVILRRVDIERVITYLDIMKEDAP